MQIVINRCFGGFGLSYEAVKRYFELKGWPFYAYKNLRKDGVLHPDQYVPVLESDGVDHSRLELVYYSKSPIKANGEFEDATYFSEYQTPRDDEDLIQVINELGDKANGRCSELKIVEIPDGIEWQISEYDGLEEVEEAHQTWS